MFLLFNDFSFFFFSIYFWLVCCGYEIDYVSLFECQESFNLPRIEANTFGFVIYVLSLHFHGVSLSIQFMLFENFSICFVASPY